MCAARPGGTVTTVERAGIATAGVRRQALRLSAPVRCADPLLIDRILAGTLAIAAAVGELARHAGPMTALAAAGCVVSVAWRREAPAVACALALAGATLVQVTGGSQNFLLGALALVLVLDYYLLGRRSAEQGWDVAAVLLLVILFGGFVTGEHGFFNVVTPPLFFGLIPFAAGRALGRHGVLTRELRLLTEQLQGRQHARLRRAAGEERSRVARELHDVVAHNVSVMVIQAVAARSVAARDREVARAALASVETCGRETLIEMRSMIGVLRRGEIDSAGDAAPGVSQLGTLVDRARVSGLPVEVKIEGHPRRLAPDVDLAAYRVVQEALTNTIKHAGPARASVRVSYSARALEIDISDTGHRRHSVPAEHGGNGLVGMRERLALYGGELHARARPGGGFQVSARIPLEEEGFA